MIDSEIGLGIISVRVSQRIGWSSGLRFLDDRREDDHRQHCFIDLVDFVLHLLHRDVDVAIEVELDRRRSPNPAKKSRTMLRMPSMPMTASSTGSTTWLSITLRRRAVEGQ